MIRVLLVDDQSIVREGLASLLQTKPDLEIVGEAENGQIAVERSLELQPDVILMDLSMPEINGTSSALLIRNHERSKAIPIMLLTAHGEEEKEKAMQQFPFEGVLLKPIIEKNLIN